MSFFWLRGNVSVDNWVWLIDWWGTLLDDTCQFDRASHLTDQWLYRVVFIGWSMPCVTQLIWLTDGWNFDWLVDAMCHSVDLIDWRVEFLPPVPRSPASLPTDDPPLSALPAQQSRPLVLPWHHQGCGACHSLCDLWPADRGSQAGNYSVSVCVCVWVRVTVCVCVCVLVERTHACRENTDMCECVWCRSVTSLPAAITFVLASFTDVLLAIETTSNEIETVSWLFW